MPWSNQGGGGPWGGGGGGQGPWGRGPSTPQQPNLEDIIRKLQDALRRLLPGGGGGNSRIVALLIGAALVLWLATGIYRVQPEEQGIALIFGKWVDTTPPGLHYNLPAPIGHVLTPKVTRVNQVEIGFRSGASDTGRQAFSRDVDQESQMLTGDENIIDIQFAVQWVIKDAGLFLFNVRNPEGTVKDVAEAAMREIIGESNFEVAYTQGRTAIASETQKLIQQILDYYGAGIQVLQVNVQNVSPPKDALGAFLDVQAAGQDKERAINEAQGYLNEVTQKAQGQAEQIVKSADAYKAERVNAANGDAQRFLLVYQQYVQNKDVTTRRIYLDTMEKILGNMDKVLISRDAASSGVVPYLPLNELLKQKATAAAQKGATP
ncbi:MAG TPA: FtsH protease activity modulator HflK [Alphaproteobacteria bacterium]|nr:FtsH protease activity modulator HflK [Alphaproteobacteria bacterium]